MQFQKCYVLNTHVVKTRQMRFFRKFLEFWNEILLYLAGFWTFKWTFTIVVKTEPCLSRQKMYMKKIYVDINNGKTLGEKKR